MVEYTHKVRVRYVDTDQMGYMHHSNYVRYFEEARWELLRNKLGISYRMIEEQGFMLPVTNVNIKYIKAACYDDVLYIHTRLMHCQSVRLHFGYRVTNQRDELICKGTVDLAFVDVLSRKPTPPPDSFIKLINNLRKTELLEPVR